MSAPDLGRLLLLLLLTIYIGPSLALLANANSPCGAQCGNVLANTLGERDIACSDDSFQSATGVGAVFKSCTECQLASTYVDPVMQVTDLQCALYNMRYAVSWCLFGYPNRSNTPDTPCVTSTACGALTGFFEYNALGTNSSAFAYCSDIDHEHVPKCDACLNQQTDAFFLNNFLSILAGACSNQPAPGQMLTIQGSAFSTTQAANVTTPSATPFVFAHPTGLSLGAKVGIAVGGLLLLLFLTGFFIICFGRRKRRAFLALKEQEMQEANHQSHTRMPPSSWTTGKKKSRFSLNRIQTYVPDPISPEQQRQPYGSEHATSNMTTAPYFDSPQSTTKLSSQPWGNASASNISINHAATTTTTTTTDWTPLSESGGIRQQQAWSPYHDGPTSSSYNSPASSTVPYSFRSAEWPVVGAMAGAGAGPASFHAPSIATMSETGDGLPAGHATSTSPAPGAGLSFHVARQSSLSTGRSRLVDIRSSSASGASYGGGTNYGGGADGPMDLGPPSTTMKSTRLDGIELREVSPPPHAASRWTRGRGDVYLP